MDALPSLWQNDSQTLLVPALAVLAALIVLGYCIYRAKAWGHDFGLFDALLVIASLGALTAAGIPILDYVQGQAAEVSLIENLRGFRMQIERYKLDHGGSVPLLYKGGFPQLVHATDNAGVPGQPSRRYCYGPYLPGGVPANPFTGSNRVIAVDHFPPSQATVNGGWLYHQETGRVAPDQAEFLDK